MSNNMTYKYVLHTGVECEDPGTPENGSRQLTGVKFGDTVRYLCDEGYSLGGSTVRTCSADGSWSGEAPVCQCELWFFVL